MKRALLATLASALVLGASVVAEPVVKGPERGALVIVGGGKVGPDILGRLFDLAGGKDAPLIVIPTANGADDYPADWPGSACSNAAALSAGRRPAHPSSRRTWCAAPLRITSS
jgi:hypothetical protein